MKSLKLASFIIVDFSIIILFLLFVTPAYSAGLKPSAAETHVPGELTEFSLSSVHGPYLLVGDNKKRYEPGKPPDETIVTLSLDEASDVKKDLFMVEPKDFPKIMSGEDGGLFGTVFLLGVCPVTHLMGSMCLEGYVCMDGEKHTTEKLIAALLALSRQGTTFTVYAKICPSEFPGAEKSERDKFNKAFTDKGFKRVGGPDPMLPELIREKILKYPKQKQLWAAPYAVEVFQLSQ